MITQAQDISIVLSGGSTNTDPLKSLGGASSATPVVSGNLNNLFDDVTADEGEAGSEEYRCVYIFNDGDTPIYNCRIWISDERVDGASVELGIRSLAEVQRIRITGEPTSGEISMEYEDVSFDFEYHNDPAVLAANLQNALNNLRHPTTNRPLLRQIRVTVQVLSGATLLDVDFSGGLGGNGQDDKKNHNLMIPTGNTLDPPSEVSTSVLQEGGPVNETAELVDIETQPPNNVGFYKPTSISPITIAKLLPEEGFALWIKRVAPTNTVPVERDGFTFRFRADSLDPLG